MGTKRVSRKESQKEEETLNCSKDCIFGFGEGCEKDERREGDEGSQEVV